MDKTEDVKKISERLLSSPVFNMSLSSKELFHSNFLAWVLGDRNLNPSENSVLKVLFPNENIENLQVKDVNREINNFDLEIILQNDSRTIVENKIKSLPDFQQLQKYSLKLARQDKNNDKKTSCILLSLTEPDFFDEEKSLNLGGYQWRYLDYATLSQTLAQMPHEKNSYTGEIIKDYCCLIDSLLSLKRLCEASWELEENILNYGGDIYSEMKKLRLHDIFEKWRMSYLGKVLRERLKKTVNLTVGYSNEQGLLDIHSSNRSEYLGPHRFMIQIQGNQLRQVIEKDNSSKIDLFKTAANFLNSGQWFIGADGVPLPDKKRRSTGDETDYGFCKFGDSFIYRHEKLSNLKRVTDLVLKMNEINHNAHL